MCFSKGVPGSQEARTENNQPSDMMGKAAHGPLGGGGSADTIEPAYVCGWCSRFKKNIRQPINRAWASYED